MLGCGRMAAAVARNGTSSAGAESCWAGGPVVSIEVTAKHSCTAAADRSLGWGSVLISRFLLLVDGPVRVTRPSVALCTRTKQVIHLCANCMRACAVVSKVDPSTCVSIEGDSSRHSRSNILSHLAHEF